MNKEDILSKTNRGLDVFRHYIGGSWVIGKDFLNPLYNDTNPSCNIYYERKSSQYLMKDFGCCEYSGDCVFVVGVIKGLYGDSSYPDVLQIINQEMNLGIRDSSKSDFHKRPNKQATHKEINLEEEVIPLFETKRYSVKLKEFSQFEIDYWGHYGITIETLSKYGVVSLTQFDSVNKQGKEYKMMSSATEPIFGYQGDGYIKIYRPKSTLRFLYGGDIPNTYCFGISQLPTRGDLLFITGGEKDVMSLYERGFNAICFNSESATIPIAIIERLSFMFKHIVILYDVDKTGLSCSLNSVQQLSEYGVKRLLLPLKGIKEEKDISDFFRLGGTADDLRNLFLELLNSLYSNTISMLKSCEVNFDVPPILSPMVISVNDIPLGTEGNLLCVTGGEGTGKSNFIGALVAGTIQCEGAEIDTLGINISPNVNNHAVILYDTEQSESQLFKNSSNILRRSRLAISPRYFKAYSLTAMSRNVRLRSIIESMDHFYHLYGGIHLVVIDGIADLISGANNESESIAIVEELYRLAGIYCTCIICVLHFVPNGLKLRGHLGSELQRKAAAILSIERESDYKTSVIKAMNVRDGSPLDVPMIQFAWDKSEGMHRYVGEKPKEDKERRKYDELTGVAREVFSAQTHYTYNDLCTSLQSLMDVKDRTAKSYIRYMREQDIITTDPENTSYLMMGLIM